MKTSCRGGWFFVAKGKTNSYDIPSCRCAAMLYLNGNDLTVQEGFGTLYKCFIFLLNGIPPYFLIGVADMTEERKETFEEEVNQSERIDADEEPLSRMSRNASRQSKQKQKQSRNRARTRYINC